MQNCSKNSENVGNCLFSVAWLWQQCSSARIIIIIFFIELCVCAGVALHEWQQQFLSVFFLKMKTYLLLNSDLPLKKLG